MSGCAALNGEVSDTNPLARESEAVAAVTQGSDPTSTTTVNEHAEDDIIPSRISPRLYQRPSSKSVARSAGANNGSSSAAATADLGKDDETNTEPALDSASSSTTSLQFRRNNPYATSSVQSLQLDDSAAPFTTNVPSATSGALRSPPPVNIVLHTSSTRVSRTTSMVKVGDARVSRTTSKASENSLLYSPQLPHNVSSLPGSERVSPTTSMMKGNESIVFSMQPLRFMSSQPDSSRASRTTSMVKGGGSVNNDCGPILSQPLNLSPQQHQHQTPPQQQSQLPSVSPILTVSPHSPMSNSFPHSAFSTGESHFGSLGKQTGYNATPRPDAESGSGSGGGDSGGLEASGTSSSAFLQNCPLCFNASAYGAMMSPYNRAEFYSNDLADADGGGFGEEVPVQMEVAEAQCGHRPFAATQRHHHHYFMDRSPLHQLHQRQQGQHASETSVGYHVQLPPPGQQELNEDVDATVPVYTPLTGYAGALLMPTSPSMCDQPHDVDLVHSTTQEFKESPARSSALILPTSEYEEVPLDRRQPSPAITEENTQNRPQSQHRRRSSPHADKKADAAIGSTERGNRKQQQAHVDPAPSSMLSAQFSRTPVASCAIHEQGTQRASTPAAPPKASPAAAATTSVPGFSVEELTAALEAALKTANEGGTMELHCPAGSQFSVYDAGMKEHFLIPSEKVMLTRGAIKYVSLFERYGNQTRFRFQLCNRYLHNRCTCGLECQYIHSHLISKSTQVHINENSITATGVRKMNAAELAGGHNVLGYPTMEPGMVFAVFPPNQLNSSPQLIPSEMILVTEGALQTYRAMGIESNSERSTSTKPQQQQPQVTATAATVGTMEVPIVRPRHCAHFQFKRMCNLGASCRFIHSLIPFVQGMVNQPPLPYPLNVSALDDRSAGFVLPKLFKGDASGDHQAKNAFISVADNNTANSSMSNITLPLPITNASAPAKHWSPSAIYPTASSVITMGDASAQMNTMFTAHYPQTILDNMPAATTGGPTAMYSAEPPHASYAAWGRSYPLNGNPYATPMTAVASFAGPSVFSPPMHEQQQQRQRQQALLANGMGGFHPAMQLLPQACPTFMGPSPPQP